MPIIHVDNVKRNLYAVTKKGEGVQYYAPIPEHMGRVEALFFAAYIVACLDVNGEDFAKILRQVRAEGKR